MEQNQLTTTNYIKSLFVNYIDQEKQLDADTNRRRDESFVLNIALNYSSKMLKLQAQVFSNYMDSKVNENLRKSIPSGKFSESLFKVYVYSYFKSLFFGLNANSFNSSGDNGLAFFGHCYLRKILCSTVNSNNSIHSDFFIGYRIDLSNRNNLILHYRTNFPFLKDLVVIDSNGNYFITDPEMERILANIQLLKTSSSRSTFKAKPKKKVDGVEEAAEPDKKEIAYTTTKHSSELSVDVRSYSDTVFNNITSFENCVLFNSFYCENLTAFRYVKHSKEPILRNRSYFLTRALFISGNFEGDSSVSFADNVYHKFMFKEGDIFHRDHLHLVSSDVFAITGIVPLGVKTFDDPNEVKPSGGSISDEIVEYITSVLAKETVDVARRIVEEFNPAFVPIFDKIVKEIDENNRPS